MGEDRYQVTEANWNYIQGDNMKAVTTAGTHKTLPSTLVRHVREALSQEFYSNSWFRALNDIQNSEKFMCHLDNIYWEVKYGMEAKVDKFKDKPPLSSREIIYKFNLGPSIPDSYFMEVRFNFYSDEITLSIGQGL
tara:strand:+ start:454 stop:861 length:408 start_codon:yes stop_codon:yes gene_type:complete